MSVRFIFNLFMFYVVFIYCSVSENEDKHIYNYRSLFSPNEFSLLSYEKSREVNFKEWETYVYLNNSNGLILSRMWNIGQMKNQFISYDNDFSIFSEDKSDLKVYYIYNLEANTKGSLRKIKCREFSHEYKDCLLFIDLYEDTNIQTQGKVIFRSTYDDLYYIKPIDFYQGESFFAYKRYNSRTEIKKSWQSFKKALHAYRTTPGYPPLETLGYKKEDIEYFDATEEYNEK